MRNLQPWIFWKISLSLKSSECEVYRGKVYELNASDLMRKAIRSDIPLLTGECENGIVNKVVAI